MEEKTDDGSLLVEDTLAHHGDFLNEVYSAVSKEMTNLTVADREQSYFDVHGVPTNYVEETPELIQDSLRLMEKEIQAMASTGGDEKNNKEGYTLAESMDPNFVHDPNLRIKFLRGERFDTKLAAKKLMKHFQVKQKLFGKSKLVKNITQSDLNQEDLDMLYSGRLQILPMKDPAGRTIVQMFPSPGTFCSFQTMVRTE